MCENNFEAAAVALMSELGLKHIEPQFALFRNVSLGRHEFEPGSGINETADQPSAGDTVDEDTLTGHPDMALQIFRTRDLRTIFRGMFHRFLLEAVLNAGKEAIHGFASDGA